MATTYLQLAQQIKTLQSQAEQVKKKELAGVIAGIKEAIAVYELTAEELGLANKAGGRVATPIKAPATKAVRRANSPAKRASTAYQDGAGNTWGGRGPRPAWLRAALTDGATLASFAAGSAAPAATNPNADNLAAPIPAEPAKATKVTKSAKAAKAGEPAKAPKVAAAPKYTDDAGNAWSGFGPKPGWFKAALAAGKSLEDLAAK